MQIVSQTKKDQKLKPADSFNSFLASSVFLYTLKTLKTSSFLMFSWGIERDQQDEMD